MVFAIWLSLYRYYRTSLSHTLFQSWSVWLVCHILMVHHMGVLIANRAVLSQFNVATNANCITFLVSTSLKHDEPLGQHVLKDCGRSPQKCPHQAFEWKCCAGEMFSRWPAPFERKLLNGRIPELISAWECLKKNDYEMKVKPNKTQGGGYMAAS